MDEAETIKLIEATLDKIRPFLQREGGDVDFVGLRDGILYVAMVGACQGCAMASVDVSTGVEMIILQEVPGIIAVKCDDIPADILKDYLDRKMSI